MKLFFKKAVRTVVCLSMLGIAGTQVYAEKKLTPPKKHAVATKLKDKIVIDGKLDDQAWSKATEYTGFEIPLGQAKRPEIPKECQTFFKVLYDNEAIYFGIKCNEPHMDQLVTKGAKKQHDAAMWGDDDLEIFLDPVGDRNEYYQFAINTDGTQVDLYLIEKGNTGKGGWSSDWEAETFKDKDFWSLEVKIPFGVFHNRPSSSWTKNWVFSISRTRKPKPSYYSQFSPVAKGGYHDVDNYGTLGPIEIDKNRYNLYAESPTFRLEPTKGGYRVFASLMLENRGKTPFKGKLDMEVLAKKSKGASVDVKLKPESNIKVELPAAFIVKTGKFPIIFKVKTTDYEPLVIRTDQWLNYTPLIIKLTQPNYRNNIYPTQKIDSVKGFVTLGMPVAKVKDCIARITLSSNLHPPTSVDYEIKNKKINFELPAKNLPIGNYTVRCEILKKIAKPKPRGPKYEVVVDKDVVMRKLPPAPAVEVRVDNQGNLLIDGKTMFPRGWYGSMYYIVSKASFPQAQMPHSTNFMMGSSEFEQYDLGIYTLKGLSRSVDEAKAKLDKPIDGELKARIRKEIAKVRNNPHIIGYYISDEPECRGLSPFFLESLYKFIAKEDPYRFCKVVSRAPAQYMQACDVMCPHPYMAPMQLEDGTRKFGNHFRSIHNIISAADGANDGSKAVWSMPQTFTYGGKYGQHPTFWESRWFTYTSIACGAKGIVPFIFNGYWNHFENRVSMNYIFEVLTLLAPAWNAKDSAITSKANNPAIDVIAKYYKPKNKPQGDIFIVAANQTNTNQKVEITVPELAKDKSTHLLVLRENRLVKVENGKFTDQFKGLGVHIYTTMEILPYMKTLDEIKTEIAEGLKRSDEGGNLLGISAKVKWRGMSDASNFVDLRALADGVKDAAGWLPWYGDRTQCVIVFDKPVTFSRVVIYSPSIKDAKFEIWAENKWKTIHEWKDQYMYRMEYKGEKVTTDKVRIVPTAARKQFGKGWFYEITEMGLYPE